MRVPQAGLYIDNPAYPLLQAKVSYWGITDSAGATDGTTIACADIGLTQPTYQGHYVKILDGDAAGQVRLIVSGTTGGIIVVDSPFSDSAGAAEQITASIRFVVLSDYVGDILYYGTSTAAGLTDGSTITDTGLATPFTVDDECIGMTVKILISSTTSLNGQSREIYDYDYGSSELYFDTPFTSQVPTSTTYVVLANRPSSGGGPGPTPEPETRETGWQLGWYDVFDVADATADTEKWSSEYIGAGAADGSADINTTSANKLYVNITAAAVAAAEYGVRALDPSVSRKWFELVDAAITVTNPNANHVWAGMSVSRGVAWDANNYIRIYKRQNNVPVEGIATEYVLAGAAAVTTTILATTQDNIAFKIERSENVWRLYYSLTLAPRHHWILAKEIEDPTNSMTDQTSTYLSVYNPEDAAGQRISCNFDVFEHYFTLGNFDEILIALGAKGGALAYMGFCPVGMAASSTTIVCTNLIGFPNDTFNSGYQMIVLKNANSAAGPPEMEMRDITDYVGATGTFTVLAFTANVEASDVVLVIHNSVAKNISILGIADAGSDATKIRDSVRIEADNYWNGQQVMMLSGAARGQVRPIVDFLNANGDIVVSPDFGAAIVAGDIYVILTQWADLVAGTDGTINYLTSQVVGDKTDTADYTYNATQSSLVRLVKGVLGATVVAEGTFTLSSATVPEDNADASLADTYNGMLLVPLTGADAFVPRLIVDWTAGTGAAGTGVFTIDPNTPFTAITGLVDYIVVANQSGYSWPYIQALMSALDSPQVDQNSIETARLSIHNLRPDGAVIAAVEYAGTVINIDRYRPGVDAAWTNIVAAAGMTEAAGYAYYNYTFPSAAPGWQDGDLVQYRISGCVVTTPVGGLAASYYVPEQTRYGCIGGISAILKKLNLVFDIVNAIPKLSETGNTVTADGTEQTLYQNETPMGIYEPRKLKLDCVNMTWGDKLTVRWYERIEAGGTSRLKDTLILEDFQESPIKNIELEPNRFGVKITIQQTVGTYRIFKWEAIYEV